MPQRQHSLAHIAMHDQPEEVLRDAVASVRSLTGESAFAAIGSPSGAFPMRVRDGLADPRWEHVTVHRGRGLGGKVLAERRTVLAPDYLEDPTITGDYRTVVRAEGLRALGCVPVMGPVDVAALLYIGDARVAGLGGRMLAELQRIAELASVGVTLAAQRAAAREPLLTIAGIARRIVDSDDPRDLRDALARIAQTCDALPVSQPEIHLTPRERDVLALLAEGASNRRIAERLVLSEPTVKGHVRALLRKLDAGSRLAAVAQARRRGLA